MPFITNLARVVTYSKELPPKNLAWLLNEVTLLFHVNTFCLHLLRTHGQEPKHGAEFP